MRVDAAHGSDFPAGGHICLVVGDDDVFGEQAAEFLAEGSARGEKTIAFGPEGGLLLTRLRPLAAVAADPHVAVLGRRRLEPETMLAAYRESAELAVREGYAGIRVAVDMDWLLPASPTAEEIVGYEVLLDRLLADLDATVVCAYRQASFDDGTIAATLCVHPVRAGHDADPPFTFVAGDAGSWRLSGTVDMGVAAELARALSVAARSPCLIDVAGLEFIDVAGMRAIAEVARAAGAPVQVRNARRSFRRWWELAGFGRCAPTVQLSG